MWTCTVTIFSTEDGDNVSLKSWYLPMSLYSITNQKTNLTSLLPWEPQISLICHCFSGHVIYWSIFRLLAILVCLGRINIQTVLMIEAEIAFMVSRHDYSSYPWNTQVRQSMFSNFHLIFGQITTGIILMRIMQIVGTF